MEHITEVVKRYLKIPQTNYSIQIDGNWGIGKTHFIMKKLVDIIEKEAIPNEPTEKFHVCYVSLNGISSVDQIGESVYFEIANPKNKLAFQAFKMLGKYGTTVSKFAGPFDKLGEKALKDVTEMVSEKVKGSAANDLSKFVLIFDDLERVSDSLKIKEVFGFINTNYLEHQNTKIIFVSNENEIKDVDYQKIKEKVIGRKLTFKQDSSQAIYDMVLGIYKKNTKLKNFFDKYHQEIITSIHFVMTDINLRTVRFVFDTFIQTFEEFTDLFDEEKDFEDAMKTLFLNVLVVSVEFKNGEIRTTKDLSFLYGSNLYFLAGMRNNKEPETYQDKFFTRYHRADSFYDENIHYLEPISHLVIEGYADFNRLKEGIKLYIAEKNRKKRSELSPIEKLYDFRRFSEEEITEAQQTIIEGIKKGEYLVADTLKIYALFYEFKQLGLLLIKNFESKFREGFPIALDRWEPSVHEETHWKSMPQKAKGYYPVMLQAIKEKIADKKSNAVRETVLKWFKQIKENNMEPETIQKLEYENNFFEWLVNLNVVNDYIIKERNVPIQLSRLLNHKYLRITNANEYSSHEIPHIDHFLTQLKDALSRNNVDKIFAFNFNELINDVEKVKEHVKNK